MPNPYIANEIILELDLTGKTGVNGVVGKKFQVECWITDYSVDKTTTGDTETTVNTLCPSGQFTLANKAGSGSYNLNLSYLSDWCDHNSLSWILVEFPNANAVPFKLIDRAGCTTGIQVDGTISQLPDWSIQGSTGQVSSVSGQVFPLNGKPTVIAAAAATNPTGVTAGTPGTWTPAGSLTPKDLAAANALGLTAGAAWTTGQYVLTGDRSEIHHDGTAFKAGKAT